MRKPLLVAIFFGVLLASQAQTLTLEKHKVGKTAALTPDRIFDVQTDSRVIAGEVSITSDSTLSVKTFYKRDSLRIDTTITVKFDSIKGITYCKARKAEKCGKRRNPYWADRWIKGTTLLLAVGAVSGPYITNTENAKLAWIWGGTLGTIGYYILANSLTGPKYYDLERKWKIKQNIR